MKFKDVRNMKPDVIREFRKIDLQYEINYGRQETLDLYL